ncbi:glycosyltransferase family 9 protein [Lacibacterium aquatile]|uniref:Glycosyltransferase family 9 protein n=1 Tax=Lacibacterium aquatile TaxID=1168082 RepID=A0ABW5DN10_9PROT
MDTKPGWSSPGEWLALRARIKAAGFARIYDLQGSGRTAKIFQLLRPNPPEWNGTAWGCALPDRRPEPKKRHPIQRHRQQLEQAGITDFPEQDWSWFDEPVDFPLPERYVLLAPGCAPHRPEKRWPALHFAELARWLVARQLTPIILGTAAEGEALATIAAGCPEALDLRDRTSLPQIARLARGAQAAVGNDTGPMHLIAAVGCPSLVLFSHASDPELSSPHGRKVRTLRHIPLADLPPKDVEQALSDLLG